MGETSSRRCYGRVHACDRHNHKCGRCHAIEDSRVYRWRWLTGKRLNGNHDAMTCQSLSLQYLGSNIAMPRRVWLRVYDERSPGVPGGRLLYTLTVNFPLEPVQWAPSRACHTTPLLRTSGDTARYPIVAKANAPQSGYSANSSRNVLSSVRATPSSHHAFANGSPSPFNRLAR